MLLPLICFSKARNEVTLSLLLIVSSQIFPFCYCFCIEVSTFDYPTSFRNSRWCTCLSASTEKPRKSTYITITSQLICNKFFFCCFFVLLTKAMQSLGGSFKLLLMIRQYSLAFFRCGFWEVRKASRGALEVMQVFYVTCEQRLKFE